MTENNSEIEQVYQRLNELLPVKYGRDSYEGITISQLIDKFIAEEDVDQFCKVVDAEFLHGAWGHFLQDPHMHWFKKDVKGLLWEICQRLRSAEEAVKAVTL